MCESDVNRNDNKIGIMQVRKIGFFLFLLLLTIAGDRWTWELPLLQDIFQGLDQICFLW